MTYEEFKNKYNGQPIDFDGAYGDQCVDLAQQYNKECLNGPFLVGDGAKDIFFTFPASIYECIYNEATNFPSQGDIVIWGTLIGPWGHIAIFDHGDASSFVSFDQNWPLDSKCHFEGHDYYGVLGWLHPKSLTISTSTMNEQDKKDIESMNKLRAYNGVWYEAQNVINDFEKMKADRQLESANSLKSYLTLEKMYDELADRYDTLQAENASLIAVKPIVCQPKLYTVQIAAMLNDLADIIERKYKK